jgi:Ca2+-binding EF-hand superfamily protein
MSYFHGPEEKTARQTYPLDGAQLQVPGGANLSNTFELHCADGHNITLSAETRTSMMNWIETLQYVIDIATQRGSVQRERWSGNPTESIALKTVRQVSDFAPVASPPKGAAGNAGNNKSPDNKRQSIVGGSPGRGEPSQLSLSHQHQHRVPTVRINVDSTTIPPGSTQRYQFEEMFINDLATATGLPARSFEVVSVRPAPGMDWLTLVEFDVYLQGAKGSTAHHSSAGSDGEDRDAYGDDEDDELAAQRIEVLRHILEMLENTSSPLYSGFLTANLDPSYTHHILAVGDRQNDNIELSSSDPTIMQIMEKYKSVHTPHSFVDVSHFNIFLRFEGNVRSVRVPNPLVLRKRSCMLWPFEVKEALGLIGNMQELWIDPVALVPCGVPSVLAKPIDFEPSVRAGGALVIHASKLKAGLTYDVQCDDRRNEIVHLLTEEERMQIQATFEAYDINGDGNVSRREMEDLIRQRTAERKAVIDDKFNEFISETTSDAEVAKAEEFRRMHYQQLQEAQSRLIKMFENADLDGNGSLSFTEFLLAEAYWMRCTLNPEHACLF